MHGWDDPRNSDGATFLFGSSSGLSLRHPSKIGDQLRIRNARRLRLRLRESDA